VTPELKEPEVPGDFSLEVKLGSKGQADRAQPFMWETQVKKKKNSSFGF